MKRKSSSGSKDAKVFKPSENGEDVSTSFHYSDNKESLYRPPTAEEMNSLKETENLFQSGLLHMEINELLLEVSLRKKKKKLEEALHLLNDLLTGLPDGKQQHELTDLSWLPKNVCVPLPPLPGAAKGTFQFFKPKSVKVVGSYLLGTMCKPQLNVNISVQIPEECLHAKDYLNLRYHLKRALYLAIIASHIKKSKMFKNIEFSVQNGNLWKPVLLLRPKGKIGEKFEITLFISLPPGFFKLARFSPKTNNIRKHWFNGEQEPQLDDTRRKDPGPATPHYNSSLLTDVLLEQHLHFLYSKISQHQPILDAIVLAKVWLHQRQFNQGYQGFTGFHVSMVIAYLLQTHQINQHMSSYQVLRILWQFLATKDLSINGISLLDKTSNSDNNRPAMTDFHEVFEVVMVDPSGYLNLCTDMTKMAFKQLSKEAKVALDILDSHTGDSFDILFLKKVSLITRYDVFFHVEDVEVFRTVVEREEFNSKRLDRAGDWLKVGLSWLQELLTKALGNRIHLITVWPEVAPKWSLKNSVPNTIQNSATLGISLDTENAGSVLEKGPSADLEQAKVFRSFWGEKSELRRFQDGTICEAVVWQCGNTADKRKLAETIIKHVLKRHGNIEPSCLVFPSNELELLLQQRLVSLSKSKTKGEIDSGTGEEGIQAVMRSFESLGKQLRNLDLKLTINSIQSLSPVLRGTEVFAPVPRFITSNEDKNDMKNDLLIPMSSKQCPRWCPANEVLISFETSGQWPDDLDAIQRIKAAFLLNIAKLLRNKYQLTAVACTTHIDALKDGYVFRIKLAHYREMVLYQQSKEVVGQLKHYHEHKAKELEREIVHLPLLSSMIHGVQQQYASFGGAVRLAKRWISSQMLMSFFSEECIELVVAYIYISPGTYTIPGSPAVGFLRFLDLLSNFDWKNKPLIVNLNNELTGPDYQTIQSHFTTTRTQLPAMVIATPKDKEMSYWTRSNPELMILKRTCLLAKESYNILQQKLAQFSTKHTDVKEIFRPPLDDYDVTISLNNKHNPRCYQALDSTKVLNYATKTTSNMVLPVINFNPVQLYLKELEESFSEIAVFFHDTYGGDVICVLWKPTAFEPSQFKVLHNQYRIPVDESGHLVTANMNAILSDFEIIGKGLVKEIKTKSPSR